MRPQEIVSNGFSPQLYEFDLQGTLSLSEAREIAKNSSEPYLADQPVVLDGAEWVASDKPLVGNVPNLEAAVWSYTTNHRDFGVPIIGKFSRRRKFIMFKIGVDGLHPFYNDDLNKLHLSREETTMSLGNTGADLDALLNNANNAGAGAPAAGAPAPMQQFSGEGLASVGETDLTKKSVITQDISKRVAGIKLGSLDTLHTFNQTLGRLVGFVTAQDAKVEFKVEDVPVKKDGNTVLNAEGNANAEVVEKWQAKKRVEPKFLVREGHLKAVQSKPGKIVGVVVKIPEGGVVGFDRFANTSVEVDTTKKDLKSLLLSYAEFKTLIPTHFNGVISELEETHGISGDKPFATTVTATPSRVKDEKKAVTTTPKATIKVATTRGGSLIGPKNYFPVKTFETVRLDGALTAEQVEALNFSMFGVLVDGSTVGRKKGENAAVAIPKYESLTPDYKARITKNPDGTISSKYITLNLSDRVPVEVLPFWSKEADFLASVEIPLKVKTRNEETGKESTRFKTYNAADEKVVAGPEGDKTSLKLPRFQPILAAASGAITQESLRALTSKSRGNAGGGKTVPHEDLIKLVYGSYSDAITEDQVSFADGNAAKALNARFAKLAVATAIGQ